MRGESRFLSLVFSTGPSITPVKTCVLCEKEIKPGQDECTFDGAFHHHYKCCHNSLYDEKVNEIFGLMRLVGADD